MSDSQSNHRSETRGGFFPDGRGCLLLVVQLKEVVHCVTARIAFDDGRILVLKTVSEVFEVTGQFRACFYEKW